ncbi:LysR family transcriptional regulator [Paenarthrobacter sp. NPDC058040]|uniref:LysR family transcriptional regulator n=1 Tax=unclassified Paenarthrobacter TaxID=2634190 RepID=UPI0036D806DF
MLNPSHLRTLMVVLRTGSFAEAARRLGYTSSAVSQQMSALERMVRMSLFERDAHGIRPTPAAEFLAVRAQEVLTAYGIFEDEVRSMAEGSIGRIRLGSFPTASQKILPQALSLFVGSPARVKIELDEGEPDKLVPLVLERDLDLALVYQYDLVPHSWPKALSSTTLLFEDLVLLLPEGHRLANTEISLAELESETWISTGERTSGARSLRRACAVAGFEPDVSFRSNDYDVVRGFVRSGLGVALVPALGHVDTEGVATASVSDLYVRRRVLAIHPHTSVNPAVQGAVTALQQAAREVAGSTPRVSTA